MSNFQKLLFLTTLLFVAGSVDARAQDGGCDNPDEYGSLLDAAEFSAAVQALPPEALSWRGFDATLQKKMLDNLPAVAQQGTSAAPGTPGSCEAQSFGYGLGSYTAARDAFGHKKWDPSLPQNSVSAAYLYALAHVEEKRVCPKGSKALGYLAQLTSYGAPNRARIPYRPYCPYLEAIPAQQDFPDDYPGMGRLRIGSYATFQIKDNPNAIGLIKAYLQNGQAVAFSGRVLCHYGAPTFESGVIYQTATLPPPHGHGQLVVGYDETVGKSGEKGALLVQNSFGDHWPPLSTGSTAPPGMAYWSYKTFANTQLLAAVAYPRSEGLGPGRLTPSSPKAPNAAITRAYQWAPLNGGAAYLILDHVFKEPILLKTISLTEPGGSSVKATATYGQYISNGYSYLKRADGKSFLPGLYGVALDGVDLDAKVVRYAGKTLVGSSQPLALPAMSMRDVAITGPTNARAIVTGAR